MGEGLRTRSIYADLGAYPRRLREDGVENAFGVDLAEHCGDEQDSGDDQPHSGVYHGSGFGGCSGSVADLVVKEEKISELRGTLAYPPEGSAVPAAT